MGAPITNSQTRFFFPASRSHHAYAMAIDHGMEFATRFGKWPTEGLLHVTGKLYVHPDSLGLLEPQSDDCGEQDGEPGQFRIAIYETGEFKVGDLVFYSAGGELPYALDGTEIVTRRQGIAFHYPEQEP